MRADTAHFRKFILAGFALLVCLCACSSKDEDSPGIPLIPGVSVYLYISPNGDDSNTGSATRPLATLEGAQAAVRQIKTDNGGVPDGGIIIWLRHGVYERTSTFQLDSQDSGEAGSPVVYRGYPGEVIRIVGGLKLDPDDFSTVTSGSVPDVWNRIDDSAKGNVMQLDLSAYTTDYGAYSESVNALELFYDGEPMQIGRWPDKVKPEDAVDETSGFELTVTTDGSTVFTYSNDRPSGWTSAEEIRLHGYWKHWWADRHAAVASLDSGTKTITLTETPDYGIDTGQPFYAYNLLEEITVPGEWYLNRSTGMLYFWPPGNKINGEMHVSVLENPIIHLSGADYVEFRNIAVEVGRYTLVDIDNGSHCAFNNCVIRNSGSHGISISGGTNHSVKNCEICETGKCGVWISAGDRLTLTPCSHSVENCRVHHFSRWDWTYNPAVYCRGVGTTVSHCELCNAPHTAILFNGNEHLFEYNDIHHVVQWSSDAGAIYGGRDWGYRGTVIRYNFIHHLKSAFPGWGQQGVYLDDCISGETVFGNIFYDIARAGIQSGGGRDNLMTNNIFVKCGCALLTDNRGTVWIKNDGSDWDLLQKIQDMNYQGNPWASAYPALAAIPNDWSTIVAEEHWLYPEGCIFSRNIGWQLDEFIHESNWGGSLGVLSMYGDISDNIEDQDPRFVNEAGLNMNLRSDSPAYDIPGFQAIPFNEIGPKGN